MDYGKQFDEYHKVVFNLLYSEPGALEKCNDVIESLTAVLDLISKRGGQFDKSVAFMKEQFRIDNKLVENALSRGSEEDRNDGFREVRKQLLYDIQRAASTFRFIDSNGEGLS